MVPRQPYQHKFFWSVLVLFVVCFLSLAIDPVSRHDWALENFLTVAAIIVLVASHRKLPLSRISYTLIFLFLLLHMIGAHYTYSLVPIEQWPLTLLLGAERNHFDRLVHLAYGLLLAYPAREFFFRFADAKGFWGYFLPLNLVMSTSLLYELIEWLAAMLLGSDLGMEFLGTQGDIWDAHKDMGLATLGAVFALLLTAALNLYLQIDFAREWSESLRVKHAEPLGEDEIVRLWHQRNPPKG